MPSDNYSLLVTDNCEEPLPVAAVVDTFEFARFAPLDVVRGNAAAGPAIFPADHAVPQYVAAVRRREWLDKRVKFERRGVPLIEAWEPEDPRALPDDPIRIGVGDPAEFLSNPVVQAGSRRVTIPLEPHHVRELTRFGRTVIDAPAANVAPVVVEVSGARGGQEAPSATPTEVGVVLDEFLTRPVIRMGNRDVALDAAHIRELLVDGRTSLEPKPARRPGAGDQPPLTVVALPASRLGLPERAVVDSPNVGVARAAMTISEPQSSRTVMPIEEWRGQNQIASAVPADVELPELDFPFVLYLPYRQEWRLLGYARGELLNSIPLAPEEETTIEIFTWDRRRIEESVATAEEREYTYEVRASRKETAEVVNEIQRTRDWKLTANGKIGLPPIKGITIQGQIGTETATQVQTTNRATNQTITEAAVQAGAKLRSSRQTKVTESVETGLETRTKRTIRNVNRSRTLTYDFFEVLANYELSTRSVPEQLRLAVLLPDPFAGPVNREFVLMHQGVLRRALLDAEFEAGIEAARWLKAREEWCALKCSECECPDETQTTGSIGTGTAVGVGTGSGTPGGTGSSMPTTGSQGARADVEAAIGRVVDAIRVLRTADWKPLERAFDTGAPEADFQDAVLEYRRWLYRTFCLNWFNPGFWAACVTYERDAAADKSPERLERLLSSAESGWIETLLRGALIASFYNIVLALMPAELVVKVGPWNAIRFTPQFGLDDAGLGTYLSQARTAVNTYKDAREAEIVTTTGTPPPEPQPEAPAVPPAMQPSGPYPADEMAVHKVALDGLLAHIELNRAHYRTAIWESMSPADRLARLNLWGDLGAMLDNEVLGFVGDRVAVPFQSWRIGGLGDVLENIASQLAANEQPVQREVVLPTAGVAIQGRLGECDLCEPYIDEHRRLDLEQRRQEVSLARQRARAEALEADRRKARLAADPPNLEPFDAGGGADADGDGR